MRQGRGGKGEEAGKGVKEETAGSLNHWETSISSTRPLCPLPLLSFLFRPFSTLIDVDVDVGVDVNVNVNINV